jgi:hypothetical protein
MIISGPLVAEVGTEVTALTHMVDLLATWWRYGTRTSERFLVVRLNALNPRGIVVLCRISMEWHR